MVDLERLCWLPLLLVGGESAVDWMEAYDECLCRCGLGERRDVMGRGVLSTWRYHQRRGDDRTTTADGGHLLAMPPLLFLPPSLARLYKAQGRVLCCQGAATYLSSGEAIGVQCGVCDHAVFMQQSGCVVSIAGFKAKWQTRCDKYQDEVTQRRWSTRATRYHGRQRRGARAALCLSLNNAKRTLTHMAGSFARKSAS